MYIVNKGILQVQVDGQIVTTLSAGNHFGEISILDMEGVGNRRTASIQSLGFSQLFQLSKNDLREVSIFTVDNQIVSSPPNSWSYISTDYPNLPTINSHAFKRTA